MNRVAAIEDRVDRVLQGLREEEEKKYGYTHLYGVAQFAALLAMKRRVNVELAMVAGLLHDIYTYQAQDPVDHARKGAELARQILGEVGAFSPQEIEAVSHAIACHSDKGRIDRPLDEVLKDADVLQHWLGGGIAPSWAEEAQRLARLREELGME